MSLRINLLELAERRRLVEHDERMQDLQAVKALHRFCVDCGRKLPPKAEVRCPSCSPESKGKFLTRGRRRRVKSSKPRRTVPIPG